MPDKPPDLKDFIKEKSDGEYTYVRPHLRRVGGRGVGGDGLFEVLILGTFVIILVFIFAIIPAAKSFFSSFWAYVYWIYLVILLVISARLVRWVYRDYRKRDKRPLPWYLLIIVLLGLMFLVGFWFLTWFWQTILTGNLYSYGCLGTILIILGTAKLYQRRKQRRQITSEAN
jgi:peptidoglycan/LPS O-acetylase OafA/YrhL